MLYLSIKTEFKANLKIRLSIIFTTKLHSWIPNLYPVRNQLFYIVSSIFYLDKFTQKYLVEFLT